MHDLEIPHTWEEGGVDEDEVPPGGVGDVVGYAGGLVLGLSPQVRNGSNVSPPMVVEEICEGCKIRWEAVEVPKEADGSKWLGPDLGSDGLHDCIGVWGVIITQLLLANPSVRAGVG